MSRTEPFDILFLSTWNSAGRSLPKALQRQVDAIGRTGDRSEGNAA